MAFRSCLLATLMIYTTSVWGQARHCQNCGVVLKQSRIFDKLTYSWALPKYSRDITIWYKDSLVIEEAQHLYITNNHITGQETWKVETDHYIFIDLRKRAFYEYKNFSDTAAIQKKYRQPDSADINDSWNFIRTRAVISTKNLRHLTDTTIEGISYRRITSTDSSFSGDKMFSSFTWAYLRGDIKKSLFCLDKPLSGQLGRPIVRWDVLDLPANILSSSRINFSSSSLTPKELKVFAAWEKNAADHPVR